MIAIQASERNGPLVGATQLFAGDEIMLISDQGTMVRTRGDEVSVVGRNTQGVRIIRLKDNENLVSLARIAEPEEEELVQGEEGGSLVEETAEGSSLSDAEGSSSSDAEGSSLSDAERSTESTDESGAEENSQDDSSEE
jgi:DNA gyrase subunit A